MHFRHALFNDLVSGLCMHGPCDANAATENPINRAPKRLFAKPMCSLLFSFVCPILNLRTTFSEVRLYKIEQGRKSPEEEERAAAGLGG